MCTCISTEFTIVLFIGNACLSLNYWQRFTSHWIDYVWLAILFTNILMSLAVVMNCYRRLQVAVLYFVYFTMSKWERRIKTLQKLLISWTFHSIHTHLPCHWTTSLEYCAACRYLSQAFVLLWYYCFYQLSHIQLNFLHVLMFCLSETKEKHGFGAEDGHTHDTVVHNHIQTYGWEIME